MALSMDEQRMLAEIERRLADDDPVLAARLTTFRLPRLALAPRSPRSRLMASLLMLCVVAVVSVFVYALMPFRSQAAHSGAGHSPTASPARQTMSAVPSPAKRSAARALGRPAYAPARALGPASARSAPSDAYGK
jgi:Protein of unknown function (DUF3040)